MLSISILCTDPGHPVNPWLERWSVRHAHNHRVAICRDYRELSGGDFLFLISCHQVIGKPVRDLFRHTLVLHASDLPRGRGMSPHIWQILEGADSLTLTLLDAADTVDAGDIWHQAVIPLQGTELYDEIDALLFQAEVEMMDWALAHCDSTRPKAQTGEPTYYRRRTPADSRIDPANPLAESFDLLRVANPERYPAHFEYRGQKYFIQIKKAET